MVVYLEITNYELGNIIFTKVYNVMGENVYSAKVNTEIKIDLSNKMTNICTG